MSAVRSVLHGATALGISSRKPNNWTGRRQGTLLLLKITYWAASLAAEHCPNGSNGLQACLIMRGDCLYAHTRNFQWPCT